MCLRQHLAPCRDQSLGLFRVLIQRHQQRECPAQQIDACRLAGEDNRGTVRIAKGLGNCGFNGPLESIKHFVFIQAEVAIGPMFDEEPLKNKCQEGQRISTFCIFQELLGQAWFDNQLPPRCGRACSRAFGHHLIFSLCERRWNDQKSE